MVMIPCKGSQKNRILNKINFSKNKNRKNIFKKKNIKIDFSILKRYTDENVDNPNIIYGLALRVQVPDLGIASA